MIKIKDLIYKFTWNCPICETENKTEIVEFNKANNSNVIQSSYDYCICINCFYKKHIVIKKVFE